MSATSCRFNGFFTLAADNPSFVVPLTALPVSLAVPLTALPVSFAVPFMLLRITMRFSLGQNRFCYMCGGARGARGHVFTRV